VLLIGLAAGAIFVRSLGSAVILLGAVSLLVALAFLLLAAPDVAITEAAIGSALTTLVYVLALRRTDSVHRADTDGELGMERAGGTAKGAFKGAPRIDGVARAADGSVLQSGVSSAGASRASEAKGDSRA